MHPYYTSQLNRADFAKNYCKTMEDLRAKTGEQFVLECIPSEDHTKVLGQIFEAFKRRDSEPITEQLRRVMSIIEGHYTATAQYRAEQVSGLLAETH